MTTIKDRYRSGLPTPELVRIDSLRKGERFTPAYGGHYIASGRSHKDQGQAIFAEHEGKETLFCASALVLPGWHEQGWLQF